MGNFVPREALFARLDGAPGRIAIWLTGPPGSGKSTLAAGYVEARNYQSAWYQIDPDDADVASFFHYLSHAARKFAGGKLPSFDPQYADNIGAYSRKFFRQLFSATASPVALVLDNLGELPAHTPLRVALEAGLAQVPRHCCIIITSRRDPPDTLARMRAGGEMVCVGAEDLRLSTAELTDMARLRGQPVSAETAGRLQERTQGWAAGVVLMLEHAKIAGNIADLPGEEPPKVIFDYLAGEIFDRFEPQTQQFLMRIACLKRMSIEVAQALGGNDKAGRLLLNLAHNDYFVREIVSSEGRIYQLHPLLRDFLINRAATELPAAVAPAARQRAAALLRGAGQVEDAVALLIENRDWPQVAAISAELADGLLAQGRSDTLAGWLELLPPELLEINPRLLLAGAASCIHSSPRKARHGFEKAFAGFRAGRDRDGMIRSCCGIIDSTILEFDDLASLDQWQDELAGLLAAATTVDPVAVAALIRATLLRDPGKPKLAEWLRLATRDYAGANYQAAARVDMARGMAAVLQGDFAAAEAFLGSIAPATADPAIKIGLALARALHHILDGDPGKAQAVARDGLALAETEGARAFDAWLHMLLAASAMGVGDHEGARREFEGIDAMDLRRGDRAVVHYLRGWLAALEGEAGKSRREVSSSLVLAAEAGIPWVEWFARVAMAQAHSAGGDHQAAAAQVRGASALSERLGGPLLQVSTLVTEASILLAAADETAALAPLRAGFTLGRQHGFRYVVGVPLQRLAELCAAALRHGIETEFARDLVGFSRLVPPPSALRLKRWPWPFQIGTLGGFSLMRGTEPIEFSAKGPGRPVELLKVLIALGGQNVRADQLADALWPHMDADYAHKSFTQTLHRLRGYFEDDALLLRDGRLSLNSALFWIDTWALEHLLAELDGRLRDADALSAGTAVKTLTEEMLLLYSGPFLPDEAEQPSYIACREQLRARLIRVVARVARRWEETGRSDTAADCYLRCIDADELCEPFYRNLMLCYQRHGDGAEALATYERLRTVLATRLKTMPSAETQGVYASLRAAAGGAA